MICKKICVAFIILISVISFTLTAEASEYDYGTDKLYEAVPEEAESFISENNIFPDGNGIAELTLEKIFDYIINEISSSVKRPLTMFAAIFSVIIISSLMKSLNNSGNHSSEQMFSIVSALTATIIISTYLCTAIDGVSNAISSASGFMLTYIPVMAGVIAVGGHASTATVFTSVMMVAIQVMTQITANVLFPVTSCFIGITACGGLNKDLKIDKLGDGLKKAVIWALGLIMTIFIGFLTIQTNISSATDSISLRAARFAVSTSVPFVGGAVSDALSTVKTSIELLKSGIGSFGIITGFCVLVPVLINALCYRLSLFVCGVISDILDAEDAGRMIRCGENVLSIVISMIVCFFLFIIVTTTLILLICKS